MISTVSERRRPLLSWNPAIHCLKGTWESKTNHHAPLYSNDEETQNEHTSTRNCDAAIQAYLDGGVPASKLVMSLPLFGRGWQGE